MVKGCGSRSPKYLEGPRFSATDLTLEHFAQYSYIGPFPFVSINPNLILYFRPQNLIAQSQSGTGKTAAFVLAMLSRVNPNYKFPQVKLAKKDNCHLYWNPVGFTNAS